MDQVSALSEGGSIVFYRTRKTLAGLVCLLFVFAAGCGGPAETPQSPGPGKTVVIATIFPLADIAKNIGGDRVAVSTLLPRGASPHTFEPTPRQMEQVTGARVLIQVGAGLDDWAGKLAGVAGKDLLRVAVTEGLSLRAGGHQHAECAGHAHEHDHNACPAAETAAADPAYGFADPHVWLDPVLVRDEIAPRIFSALCQAAPEDADYFAANLESYQAELTVLHADLTALTAGFERRSFIAYHSAWGYFADRYGLVEAATVEEAPGKEPSPGWIMKVVETARAHQAGAIFAEPQFSTKAAEVIAAEYGARVLVLDPLGGEDIPGYDSYVNLMRSNAAVLAEGLSRVD
ncbi:periplasmic solute binding protein [Candidatus Desulforudis audaxviator MP104C]|uniref:Periplasmic solute binding protein n=1 Tax=Desulforudis audaxviator (strain MP104C) TaxID=477974 RepID=B1I2Y7_DESAP|nr:periplasmic solute binding protein [Candidatus Desulforudis audaxviator MP104C]